MTRELTSLSADALLTAKELSQRIPGLPVSTIYRMSAKGHLPSVPVGASLNGVRFIESHVRAALASLVRKPRACRGKKREAINV